MRRRSIAILTGLMLLLSCAVPALDPGASVYAAGPWYTNYTPLNLGNDFYARIMLNSAIALTVDPEERNVENADMNDTAKNSRKRRAQYWHFIRNDDGTYQILSPVFKDADGDYPLLPTNTVSGSNVKVGYVAYRGDLGQKWLIYDPNNMGPGYYIIRSAASEFVLNVDNQQYAPGSNVQIWTYTNSGAEHFLIEKHTTHSYTTIKNAKSATCTVAGYTGDKYCVDCGKKISSGSTIKAGHKWDQGKVTTKAKYFTKGVKTYTCTRCGEKKTKSIPTKDIAKVKPARAKLTSASVRNGKLKLKWKRIAKKTKGYQIGLKDKKTGMTKYVNVKQTKKSTVTKVVKKLDRGRKYAVKVRAYNKVEGHKVYGKWSNVKSGKL